LLLRLMLKADITTDVTGAATIRIKTLYLIVLDPRSALLCLFAVVRRLAALVLRKKYRLDHMVHLRMLPKDRTVSLSLAIYLSIYLFISLSLAHSFSRSLFFLLPLPLALSLSGSLFLSPSPLRTLTISLPCSFSTLISVYISLYPSTAYKRKKPA
jgi:hypothetical protein